MSKVHVRVNRNLVRVMEDANGKDIYLHLLAKPRAAFDQLGGDGSCDRAE